MIDSNLNMNLSSQNQNNLDSFNLPKFENLSYGTLRRYQSFYNIKNELGGNGKSKEELLILIKNHFINMEVDHEKVIDNFLKIEKDQTNDKNNSLRKSIRFQEKNMAKFLDNSNTFNTK